MRIRSKSVRKTVARLDSIIKDYKLNTPKKKRDYQTYEQQFAQRMRKCFKDLRPLIKEAVSQIKVIKFEKRGAESKLSLEQRVTLILIKHLIHKSNRNMSYLIVIFTCLHNIDISYKTIERMYSNSLVRLALYNLHILILRKRDIEVADACGDGTGYTVHIYEHYASTAQKRKEDAKVNSESQKFIYSFGILDLKTRLYVGFGMSLKSEKEAFLEALKLVAESGIKIKTLRLDRYFSAEAYVNICTQYLGDVDFFLIPKSNIEHIGLGKFADCIIKFVKDTHEFLSEYFKRNQSESAFSEDKKRTGWNISQKIPCRIDTANMLNYIWHNLSWMGADV